MSEMDHADAVEASGKWKDEDFDTEMERRDYERYLDSLYEQEREQRSKRGL